jgi:CheY-like chemotaxis protein
MELLRLEAARQAQADRATRVPDVLDGAMALVSEVLRDHALSVHTDIQVGLPAVCVNEILLRQMLLHILGYLIDHATDAVIELKAGFESSGVRVSVHLDPPTAVEPAPESEVVAHLSALVEMADLSGAHVQASRLGQSLLGIELHLPTAEHTVLIVDDNEDVLELYRAYLAPHRYRVVTAQTADDALSKARDFEPYAITLDLMMPEKDGWNLLQALLHNPQTSRIPIIVCTVLKQKELALLLGATSFLEKPVTEDELLAALDALEAS